MGELVADESMPGHWLVKQPNGFGSEQRRWFQMVGPNFNYYEHASIARAGWTESAVGLKGSIELSSSSRVQRDGMTIKITNPDRTWVLTAVSLLSTPHTNPRPTRAHFHCC